MGNQWMVRAGHRGFLIDEFRTRNCVAIGYAEMGDISGLDRPDKVAARHDETYPDLSRNQRGASLGQLKRFLFQLHQGDGVISYDPNAREYLVGRITGDWTFRPDQISEYGIVRDVEWLGTVNRDDISVTARNRLGSISTLFLVSDEVWAEFQTVLSGEGQVQTPKEDSLGLDSIMEDHLDNAHEFTKDKVKDLDWMEMQELVAGILRAMGYKTLVSAPGPDRGKDIIASPDGLGLESPRIRVEVKHRKERMGAPDIRAFIGALQQGDKGLYVSTGGFAREAHYEAERANVPVTLIDLDRLVTLLVEHYENLDIESRQLVPLKKVYWPT